jgi:hypothetical protein
MASLGSRRYYGKNLFGLIILKVILLHAEIENLNMNFMDVVAIYIMALMY